MTATETTRASAVLADEALLNRSDALLQDFDRAFRMFHEFVTGCRALHDVGRAVTVLGSARWRRKRDRALGSKAGLRSPRRRRSNDAGPERPRNPKKRRTPRNAGPKKRRAQTAQSPDSARPKGPRRKTIRRRVLAPFRSVALAVWVSRGSGPAWLGPCAFWALRFSDSAFFGFCVVSRFAYRVVTRGCTSWNTAALPSSITSSDVEVANRCMIRAMIPVHPVW